MIIDTHCHLDFPEFQNDLDGVLKRAEVTNVKYIINVASSLEGSKKGCELASKLPQVFASVGIHPHHARDITEDSLNIIENLARTNEKVIAIGEVGLDFYKNLSPKKCQRDLFLSFLELKKKLNLPIIIHSRDAAAETLDILKSEASPFIDGVMHCFSQDTDYMKKVLDLGLHISFTCNITFKNASRLRGVVKYAPIDRLVLETDAPFLAPQKYRGKRNEPAYLVYLVEALSLILNITKEKIEEVTTRNANRLFRLGIECE
ncbi:MAG: TatD family hydrolase [Candidatus Omnitrophica bacterium]|nr:TatD family hydrolase [Candidatus Omnitrophota bacterium]